MIVLYCLLGIIGLLLAVILLRTALFRPKAQPEATAEAVSFNRDKAVSALAELIKCKTVSYNDPALENDAEFQKLDALLPSLYPRVFDVCSVRVTTAASRCTGAIRAGFCGLARVWILCQ